MDTQKCILYQVSLKRKKPQPLKKLTTKLVTKLIRGDFGRVFYQLPQKNLFFYLELGIRWEKGLVRPAFWKYTQKYSHFVICCGIVENIQV